MTTTRSSSSTRPAMAQRQPSLMLILLLLLVLPSITVAFLLPLPPSRSSTSSSTGALAAAATATARAPPRPITTATPAATASNDDEEDEDEDEEEEEDRGPRPPRPSTPAPIPIYYDHPSLPTRAIDGAWNGQRKPLLRLGTKGVQKSHRNSLNELLAAHKAVRVKVNGPAPADVVKKIADNLAAAPPGEEQDPVAVVLRVKGKEFLLVTPQEMKVLTKGKE